MNDPHDNAQADLEALERYGRKCCAAKEAAKRRGYLPPFPPLVEMLRRVWGRQFNSVRR